MDMESLTVLFPLSGVETSILLPPLVAFFVSLLSSTGGLSGAFLLLPFQMSVLGFTTPAVTSTNLFYNVISIPGGAWQYFREGRIVWPLVGVMVAGTIPGTALGYYVRVRYLPEPEVFKIFVGAVLALLSLRLLWQVVFPPSAAPPQPGADAIHRGSVKTVSVGLGRIEYDFGGEVYSFPTVAMFVLSVAVGVVGGAYGIGGGAILAPFWVAIFHLPVYTIAGASLIGTFLTSIAGVLFYLHSRG